MDAQAKLQETQVRLDRKVQEAQNELEQERENGARSQQQLQETQAAHQEEMQMAKDGAKMLLKELADEKKSKEFHFAKAREFYKQLTDVQAELEKLRGAS